MKAEKVKPAQMSVEINADGKVTTLLNGGGVDMALMLAIAMRGDKRIKAVFDAALEIYEMPEAEKLYSLYPFKKQAEKA
jgi:succinyl-CoA synthetase beta subunit